MIYRADVPGIGAVYIQADSPYDAALLWQDRFLRQMGLRLPAGTLVPPPVEVAGVPDGTPPERIIGSVPVLPQQPATPPANTEPPGQSDSQNEGDPQQTGDGNAESNNPVEYIVRITGLDGSVEYVRVRAMSPAEARSIVSGQYPSFVNISGANSAEFFYQNDPEFRQRAGDSLSSFVNGLDDKTLSEEDSSGQDHGQGDTQPEDSEGGDKEPPAPGPLPLIVKVVLPDGSIRFVTVATTESDVAREIAKQHFGPDARIVSAHTLDHYLQHPDDDFAALWNQLAGNQGQTPEQFLAKLEQVQQRSDGTGQPGNGDGDGSNGEGGGSPEVPFDIQDFPLPTFQNALEALGYDPDGVIGGLLNQRYSDIMPAFQIGSLTGSFDPIGNTPGSLQNFFETQFGNLGLAADVFRDLIAGNAAYGLDADSLLALQAFANPDFGTYNGRGNAGLVLDLAQAAAADRFGSFIARNLLPSNQRLLNEYERLIAAAGGVPELSFLEFARQQSLLPAEF